MIRLIGLSGRRGSGKDTVAQLIRQLQPERLWHIRSFGDSIKAVCAALTGEDVASYYSQEGKAERVPTFGRSRGEMLQQVGSALRAWEPLVWVDAFFAGLPPDAFVLVPDVRFANEADPIRARGGIMLRVEGDPLQQRGDGTRDDYHSSEVSLDEYAYFDYVIQNNGSLQDLQANVVQALVHFSK